MELNRDFREERTTTTHDLRRRGRRIPGAGDARQARHRQPLARLRVRHPGSGAGETAVAAAVVLIVLTVGAYLPTSLYPVYQGQFGFSDLAMVSVYATFALVSAPALLLLGPASDVVGRVRMLRLGLVLGLAGTLCFLLADNVWWLLAGRALQGLALGAATGPATAMIVDAAAPAHRGRASMLASAAFIAGTALGPVTGGVLAQYAPAPLWTPYLLHIGLLAGARLLLAGLPEDGPATVRGLSGWRPTRPRVPAGLRPEFLVSAALGFLAWAVVGVFLSTVPAVLEREAGITNVAFTGGFLALMFVCSLLVQPLIPRLPARLLQYAGLLGLLLSLIVLILGGVGSVEVVIAATVLAGAGHGLAYGAATVTIDARVAPEDRGGVNGALYLAFYLGSGLPAVVIGLLTLRFPLGGSVLLLAGTTAVLTVVTAAVTVVVDKRTPTTTRATAPLRQ